MASSKRGYVTEHFIWNWSEICSDSKMLALTKYNMNTRSLIVDIILLTSQTVTHNYTSHRCKQILSFHVVLKILFTIQYINNVIVCFDANGRADVCRSYNGQGFVPHASVCGTLHLWRDEWRNTVRFQVNLGILIRKLLFYLWQVEAGLQFAFFASMFE